MMTKLGHASECKLIKTPQSLTGELFGAYYEDLEQKSPLYNGTALQKDRERYRLYLRKNTRSYLAFHNLHPVKQ